MKDKAPGRSHGPWKEAHTGAGFLARTVALGGPTLDNSFPERLHPMERAHAGAACEELHPVGKTHAGAVREGLYHMSGVPCWSREKA